MKSLSDLLRNAGVVGAGGAGFPTHVKAQSKSEFVVANGAECEPLLHKDTELMIEKAARVVKGLELMLEATGAKEGIIGVKQKKKDAIAALEKACKGTHCRVHPLGDYYPTGDEYVLVYETTGRLIPPRGLPIQAGVVVDNIETLINVSLAAEGKPVTQKMLTVAGAVKNPMTVSAPLGTSFEEVLRAAGGITVEKFGIFIGGVMMGRLTGDLQLPVTKTTNALIVLPEEHQLVRRMRRPQKDMYRIGKSACDQCSYCTEFCPRYLLGYDIQPHRVMRSLGFTASGEAYWNQYAQLCSECGLCTLFSCPESLYPREACQKGKRDFAAKGLKWDGRKEVKTHPMMPGRRVPVKRLVKRLGLTSFDVPAPLQEHPIKPSSARILLQQHVGKPAVACVKAGDRVKAGQMIAATPEKELGVAIHASMDGVVKEVGTFVLIQG
ncbi:MAG: 4Fe-4S dicluster domain-containing protein [Verrucomicrobiae bacterium]|nr:4Fe-4S dicluster domain-containing protein [Verrucomicrobiae bacterium]